MGTYVFITALILIASCLLILVVLVQNSKGGGLASNFAGSNQIMGVKKTTDFLEKATWTLAIALLVLSLTTAFVIPRNKTMKKESELKKALENTAPIKGYEAAPTSNQPATGTTTPEEKK